MSNTVLLGKELYSKRDYSLDLDELSMHTLITGQPGGGKTEMVSRIISALLELGWSGTVVDLKGDNLSDFKNNENVFYVTLERQTSDPVNVLKAFHRGVVSAYERNDAKPYFFVVEDLQAHDVDVIKEFVAAARKRNIVVLLTSQKDDVDSSIVNNINLNIKTTSLPGYAVCEVETSNKDLDKTTLVNTI